jgi:hypothetical protein
MWLSEKLIGLSYGLGYANEHLPLCRRIECRLFARSVTFGGRLALFLVWSIGNLTAALFRSAHYRLLLDHGPIGASLVFPIIASPNLNCAQSGRWHRHRRCA